MTFQFILVDSEEAFSFLFLSSACRELGRWILIPFESKTNAWQHASQGWFHMRSLTTAHTPIVFTLFTQINWEREELEWHHYVAFTVRRKNQSRILSLPSPLFKRTSERTNERTNERETEREKEKNTRRWQSFLKVKETSFASFSFFLKVFSLPVRSRVVSYSWSVESVCAYKARHCRSRSKEEEEEEEKTRRKRKEERKRIRINWKKTREKREREKRERENERRRERWNIFSFLTSTFKFQSFAWRATEERVGDEFRKGNYHHSLPFQTEFRTVRQWTIILAV